MGEAAPPAASGCPSAGEVSQGLGWLELMWGDGVYLFGYDAELGWWVRKKVDPEFLLTAPDLTELGEKLNGAEPSGAGGGPA
jgi:hypothetical protein